MKRFRPVFAALLAAAAAQGFGAVEARYVMVDLPRESATLSLAEVEVFVGDKNVAPTGTATQSSTANDGVAKRAIDGNTADNWNSGTITHSEENVPFPAWELDLGKAFPIDRVVVWNRGEGLGGRLNGVRVTLLDAARKVVWEDNKPQTGRQNFFVTDKPGKGPRVGQRAETLPERAERARVAALAKAINLNALRDGLKVYSEKYPEAYPNAKEIAAGIDALQKRIEGGEKDADLLVADYRKLQKQVLLQHPAVDFDEIIFVSRARGSRQGLFQNYQGNTGWLGNNEGVLRGYKNQLLRGPLDQDKAKDGKATVLRDSSVYMGDLCLDWDGKTILMSSGEEEKGTPWGIYEIDVDGKNWRPAYKNDDKAVDYYDACYLPDGRIVTTASVGFQGVPCVSGGDIVSNLVLINKARDGMRRLTFDQDCNWNPEVYPNGRVVYLRWEYTDSAHYFSRVLMTMNQDGTDQQEFYGSNSYWPNSIFGNQNIPGSSTKFVGIVSGHHGVARKGELVMFDVAKGRIETQGAIHKFGFAGKPIENITLDRLVDNIKPYFIHPRPLND